MLYFDEQYKTDSTPYVRNTFQTFQCSFNMSDFVNSETLLKLLVTKAD